MVKRGAVLSFTLKHEPEVIPRIKVTALLLCHFSITESKYMYISFTNTICTTNFIFRLSNYIVFEWIIFLTCNYNSKDYHPYKNKEDPKTSGKFAKSFPQKVNSKKYETEAYRKRSRCDHTNGNNFFHLTRVPEYYA